MKAVPPARPGLPPPGLADSSTPCGDHHFIRSESRGLGNGGVEVPLRNMVPNFLISSRELPDTPLIIPCSIQGKNSALAAEVTKNEAFRATDSHERPGKFTKFPVFFPVSRESRRRGVRT
jgi:hypothetical protein